MPSAPRVSASGSRDGRRRSLAAGPRLLAGLCLALSLAASSWPASSPAVAAEPFAYCFPTCSTTDGRFLVVPGGGAAGFGPGRLTVKIRAAASATQLRIGLFDADTGGRWDQGHVPLRYEIFTDPDGNGVGDFGPLITYTGTGKPDHEWFDFLPLTPHPLAQLSSTSPYRYLLVVTNPDPLPASWSAFKVRSDGELRIPPQTVSFLAPLGSVDDASVIYPDYPALDRTTYDGSWEFLIDVPSALPSLDVWDGDLDFGSTDCAVRDVDDVNTPNGVPAFAVGTAARPEGEAVAEDIIPECLPGIRPSGNPPDDDLGRDAAMYRRRPSVWYQVVDPTGTNIYRNLNPSGNLEWERYGVALDPHERPDHLASNLPPGIYRLQLFGMDLANVSAIRLPYDLVAPQRFVRVQVVTTRVAGSDQDFAGQILPGGPSYAYGVSVPAGSLSSAAITLALSPERHTLSQSPVAAWSLVGYSVAPDPSGSATCTSMGAVNPSAAIPPGTDRHLVCVAVEPRATGLRSIRFQAITAPGGHPAQSMSVAIAPGGATVPLALQADEEASVVETRAVRAGDQLTVTQGALPDDWRPVGYQVKLDEPPGSARCTVDGFFTNTNLVPGNEFAYLVCVRNDFVAGLRPTFIHPVAGQQAIDFARAFEWTAVAGADAYELEIGSSPGAADILDTGPLTTRTVAVTAFSMDRPIWVRALARVGGLWRATEILVGSGAPPRFVVPRGAAPTLDGRIDASEWQDAVAISGLIGQFDRVAHPRATTFWMKYDGERVYLAQRSTLAPGELARGPILRPLQFPDQDNLVAFGLAPRRQTGADGPTHYQFKANVRGSRWQQEIDWLVRGYRVRYPQNLSWNPTWSAVDTLDGGDTVWESEYAVRLADLRVASPEGTWGVLLARDYPSNDQSAIALSNDWRFGPADRYWGTALYDNYRLDERYASATFSADLPVVQVPDLGALAAGRLEARLIAWNRRPVAQRVDVRCQVWNGDRVVFQAAPSLRLAGGGRQALTCGPQTFPAGGGYRLLIEAILEDGTTLFRQDVPFTVGYEGEQGHLPVWFSGPHKDGDYLGALMSPYNPIRNTVRAKVDLHLFPEATRVARADVTVRRPGETSPFARFDLPPFRDGITEGGSVLPPIGPGVYRVTARVWAADDSLLGQSSDLFIRHDHARDLPWLGTTVGASDQVLPPWTPIEANPSATELRTWNRSYTLDGSGLPAQLVSGGVPLLAGPVRVEIVQGGVPVSLATPALPQAVESLPHRARVQGRLDGAGWTVRTEATLEYDGFLRYAIDVEPSGTQATEMVRLVLPLRDALAVNLHAAGSGIPASSSITLGGQVGRLWHSGEQRVPQFRSGLRVGTFKPFVWVGDARRGLAFMADNDQGWVPDDTLAVPALEVRRTGGGSVDLVLNLVARPFTFAGPRRIVFGLQATPVRPLPDDVRQRVTMLTNTKTFTALDADGLSVDGMFGLGYNQPGAVYPLSWDKNRTFRIATEAEGFHYTPFQVLSQWISALEVDDPRVPGLAGADLHGYLASDITSSWSIGEAAISRPDAEYRLYRLQRWIQENATSGFYLDAAYPSLSTNVDSGQAYRLDLPDRPGLNGQVQPGYSLLMLREFLKRLRTLILARGLEPHVIVHATDTFIVPAYAFADYLLDGENDFARPDLAFSEAWTPEQLQATNPSAKWGLASMFLSAASPPGLLDPATHQVNLHGWLMLHDADVFETHFFWNGYVQDGLDLGRPAEFLAYWDRAVSAALRSSDPQVYASAWRQGSSLFVLAFNRGRDTATATDVEVDLAGLGIASSEVTDVRDIGLVGPRPPLGVQTTPTSARVTLDIAPHLWRVIRIDFR